MHKSITLFILTLAFSFTATAQDSSSVLKENPSSCRKYWVNTMIKIADPVLRNTAAGTLKANMPYQSTDVEQSRRDFCYLEALGRTLCGIAPWLEADGDEKALKKEYRRISRQALANAVDPSNPDYMAFDHGRQPLVDAAYLAEGLLRAPEQLFWKQPEKVRSNIITALKQTRTIKPGESNWLLFASMVEAALLEFTSECDSTRLYYGVRRFRDNFYKGDAMYGDGKDFHMDYYNSYVIQPMLLDVLTVMQKHNMPESDFIELERLRHTRYSEILERMIAPDGTYPVLGRSITACRFGTFHALGQDALNGTLPSSVTAGQVRSALTAVLRRQMDSPVSNFDENGWLLVGFVGNQLEMSEKYVNTGSLYHCLTVFLPLGLPSDSAFWSEAPAPWTSVKAWNGMPMAGDHAIKK